tara:strand:- start:258 stop:416 length:159 start_codon:yes stop_codon:yes gene_type:complete
LYLIEGLFAGPAIAVRDPLALELVEGAVGGEVNTLTPAKPPTNSLMTFSHMV